MGLDVRWEPGIGDPTFMGWFTVVAYFVAAFLCGAAARAIRARIPAEERGRQVAVWWGAALLFVALGINKQLDLQSWFTAVGRAIAIRQGWLERRREVQLAFVVIFSATAVAALVVAAWSIRGNWREYGLLLLGAGFTVTFIVVRATSFHHVETFLDLVVAGARMNWVLELSGIGVVSLAAARRLGHARRRPESGGP